MVEREALNLDAAGSSPAPPATFERRFQMMIERNQTPLLNINFGMFFMKYAFWLILTWMVLFTGTPDVHDKIIEILDAVPVVFLSE